MPKSGGPQTSGWLSRNVVLMSLASLFSDMSHEAATAVLPLYLASIGAGAGALGVIEGVADAASSLLKFLSGHYSDRLGHRKGIAVAGYSLTAVGKAAFAFATSWTSILGLRVLAWIGRGSRGPVRDAMLAGSVPSEAYGRAFGLHRAMDTVGAFVGPALALLLLSRVHFRTIFLLTFIPGAAAVVAMSLVREPQHIRSIATLGQSFTQLPSRFKAFLVGAGIFGLGNFAHTLLILRAADVLRPQYGTRANAVAIGLYTLHNVIYAAASFPAGALGDHVARRSLLASGYLIFGLVAFGFAVGENMAELVILFILAGLYIAIVDAIEASYAAELLPISARGGGFGILGLVNGLGDLVSSVTVGWIWSRWSAEAAFSYAGLVAFGGAIVLVATAPGKARYA